MTEVVCVWDEGALLGEGPVWVERDRRLYWVDIKGKAIHRYDPANGGKRSWRTAEEVGAIQPTGSGGFVVARQSGFAFAELPEDDAEAHFRPIADPEPDLSRNRFNDGKIDSAGRFWAGTMDDGRVNETGVLYRLDPDLTCRTMDAGYVITNGPAFSPDGKTLYHTNTLEGVVYAFDLDAAGGIANKRPFIRIAEDDGYPDGMSVDTEGCLWIAIFGGWRVNRFSPAGESIGQVAVPAAQVTSCVFAGAGLDEMYITTSAGGLSEEARKAQPLAGGLFHCRPGAAGPPATCFAG